MTNNLFYFKEISIFHFIINYIITVKTFIIVWQINIFINFPVPYRKSENRELLIYDTQVDMNFPIICCLYLVIIWQFFHLIDFCSCTKKEKTTGIT